MNPADITTEVTHGNLGLQRVLRNLVQSLNPSFIPGNIYVVFNTSDSAYVQYAKDWDMKYDDGTNLIQTSIAAAVTAASSNRHDVILVNAQNAHTPTSMLTISKNRLHFYGMGMREGGVGFGARARITMGDSTVSADIALMQNTGVGNTFDNLKFDSSSTVAASLWGVAEGGEYSIYRNCEFYKSSDLNETTAGELLLNGDSAQFFNCTFGSNVNAIVGAIIRPCVHLARETISGKVCRDSYFENCLFWRNAGNAANAFVNATGTTDVERMLMFKNCEFFATELGSQPAEAVTSSGGKQTEGLIALKNCSAWNCVLLKEASVGIWVDGAVPTHNTTGVAVEA
jgi:hypothetical protein